MNKINNQIEYEGYLNLIFENPYLANQFLINYYIYEQYWIKQYIQGLFTSLDKKFNNYFKFFEIIIMKKEPNQISVEYSANDNKVIVKLWIVCQLTESFLNDEIEQNKNFIIKIIQEQLITIINQEYKCKTTLKYLDIAANLNDEYQNN